MRKNKFYYKYTKLVIIIVLVGLNVCNRGRPVWERERWGGGGGGDRDGEWVPSTKESVYLWQRRSDLCVGTKDNTKSIPLLNWLLLLLWLCMDMNEYQ